MRGDRAVLALLAAAQFVVILDGSIVNMALPVMARDLDLGQGTLSWVVNAYSLTFGGFLLVGGRLADRLGARTVLVAGFALFSTASAAAGLASGGELLVLARAAQGLGAALLGPSTLALVSRHFADGPDRTRALAVWGAVSIAGGPAGGVLGGMLAGSLGWSSVFLVNVPLGLVAALVAIRIVPMSPADPAARFGVGGAALVTAGVTAFVLAMLAAGASGPFAATSLVALATSGVLLALFAVTERRATAPLIPRTVGGARLRTVGVLGFVVGLQYFGAPFYLTLQLQHVLLQSPLEAGVAFLPWGAVAVVSSRTASRVIAHLGGRAAMAIGFALLAAGLASFARIGPATTYAGGVLPGLVLHAAGTSLVGVALNVMALRGAAPETAGIIGGALSSAQQIGGAVGLALLVGAYGLVSDVPPAPTAGALLGLRMAYLLAAALAVGGIVAAVALMPRARARA